MTFNYKSQLGPTRTNRAARSSMYDHDKFDFYDLNDLNDLTILTNQQKFIGLEKCTKP